MNPTATPKLGLRLSGMVRRIRIVVFFAVLGCAAPTTAGVQPLATGRLDYRLSWNGIPAGDATVTVAKDEHGSAGQYRVDARVRTGWLVDLLWSLRGRVASSFTAADLVPLGFRYDREVNHEHSVTDVVFDSSAAQATGTHSQNGRTKVLDVREAGVVDPVTAVFRALSEPVHVGDTLRYEVFTGESRYRVEMVITGEEAVTVSAGTFWAWRVEPRVWKLGSGIDRRLRHATLWVSEAPVRTLLRIRSEVFIGAVNCELLRVSPPEPAASL